MRRLLKSLGFLTTVCLFGLLSFNPSGDLRYNVDGWTIRHWVLAPSVKPACALPRSGGYPCGSSGAATSYTLSGPTTGSLGQATSNYTVQANGTAAQTITPNDTSSCGFFTPTTVNLANTNEIFFTYTPIKTGSYNIATTNSGTLTNPAAIGFSISNLLPGYPGFTAGWTGSSLTLTTGVADPCGGSAAASILENTTNDYHQVLSSSVTLTANQTYTISMIVKQSVGSDDILIGLSDPTAAAEFYGIFNPSNGQLSTSSSWGGATVSSTRSIAVGSWWLVQVVGTLGNFTSGVFSIDMLLSTDIAPSPHLGDGTSKILIYGAALQ